MIKILTNVLKEDKERFAVPKKVKDICPSDPSGLTAFL